MDKRLHMHMSHKSKNHRLKAYLEKFLFSQFSMLGHPDQSASRFSLWWKLSFWVSGSHLLTVTFTLCPSKERQGDQETETERKKEREALRWLFLQEHRSHLDVPIIISSSPNDLPKAHLPIPSRWNLQLQHRNLGITQTLSSTIQRQNWSRGEQR